MEHPPPRHRRWAWTRIALLTLGLLAASMTASACARAKPKPADGPIRIVVSIPPLAGIVRPLATIDHEITMLIKPGQSCHGHEMTPADAAALARADVVVYVGLGLEPQLESMLRTHRAPNRRVVCFADVVGIKADDHANHHHGPDEECDHGPVDPHLWVDPSLVKRLIPAVGQAVREAMKGRAGEDDLDESRQAEAILLAAVEQTDADIRLMLQPVVGEAIVTHHDAFGRMAERYGLTVAAVIRPIATDEPTPAEIAAAVRVLQAKGARAVFIEPQFSGAAAMRIAETARVPLGRLDVLGDGDWFAMMRANAAEIARVLAPSEDP